MNKYINNASQFIRENSQTIRLFTRFAIFAMILLLVVFTCKPMMPAPTPTKSPLPSPSPTPLPTSPPPTPTFQCDEEGIDKHIVPNELIFSGKDLASMESEIIDSFKVKTSTMKSVINVNRGMEHRLYQRDISENYGQTIAKINSFYQSQRGKGKNADNWVFVDFNYVTYAPFGDPDGDDGDPVGHLEIIPGADSDDLQDQWALDASHMNIVRLNPPVDLSNFHVAIFDTSPYTENNATRIISSNDGAVNFPINVFNYRVESPGEPTNTNREHGVFIAGLINQIAPGVSIDLIRVLDDDGRGDLFSLIKALNDYQNIKFESGKWVVNLSLGIGDSEKDYFAPRRGMGIDCSPYIPPGLATAIEAMYKAQLKHPPGNSGLELLALEISIKDLVDHGVVVIAAAGNDTTNPESPEPAQAPASFDSVIAVGASNIGSTPSCFSNIGAVYAPGGDTQKTSNGNCITEPLMAQCSNGLLGCHNGIISITSTGDYALWQGTSFSTAFVSGFAVLELNVRWNNIFEGLKMNSYSSIIIPHLSPSGEVVPPP